MPVRQAIGHRRVAVLVLGGRVVLEPGQAPRAVQPDAAQEADLADRGADVRRQPRAGRQHQQHVARRSRGPTTPRRPRRRRTRRRRPPRPACATRHSPIAPRPPAGTSAPTPPGGGPTRRSPMPVTRTSLPGGAVVAVANRCRASRFAGAPRSCGGALHARPPRRRSAPSAAANTASSASAGWIEISSATVTPSRRIHPHVENSDMYMWSSTNTWLRSIASRFEISGRSWCAMVATDACSRATCDSSAMVTRSRKRRCTRPLITRRNHVAAVERPRPTAAASDQPAVVRQHAVGEQLQPQARAARRAAPPAATGRTTRSGAAARPRSPACAPATSTTAPAACRHASRTS